MDKQSVPATQCPSGGSISRFRRRARHRLASPNYTRGLASAAIAASLALLILAPLAFGKIVFNTIDPLATLTDRGRLIVVTGPIACTRGEQAFLRVTVTQRITGAVAEGRSRVVCSGNSQQWEVHAATQGEASFEQGPAIAVAIARSADHGKITDAHQWLVEVTLIAE